MPEGIFGFLLIVPLGLCFGSFATAMIARIPVGKSWIASASKPERSSCPRCGHTLGIFDLVPLLSWIGLRGRCRYCRHAIGWRYPLTECLTLGLCVAVYMSWGLSIPGVMLMLAVPFIVAMLVIDIEHLILPDQLQVILFVIGFFFIVFQDVMIFSAADTLTNIVWAFFSSFVFFLLALALASGGKFLLKREALGMGDVKFFAVAGLWLGLASLSSFLLLAGAGGVVMGLIWRFVVKQQLFPFGPALILSFFLLLLLRGPLVSSVLRSFLEGVPGLS